ncbi:hypothetical protein E2C01_062022 [Portunus trituberculatus]|uniref:Uncharacterized protein n=1 Tax=Portunus trituberculatus TaxID=210409 RepID=A0A5B7HCY1_PORTR|nr:hypothetical protein [Portunus trituberculatus]
MTEGEDKKDHINRGKSKETREGKRKGTVTLNTPRSGTKCINRREQDPKVITHPGCSCLTSSRFASLSVPSVPPLLRHSRPDNLMKAQINPYGLSGGGVTCGNLSIRNL